jgi:hypothetical protein
MNHSMYSADRGTHLRIVVVALACAIVVAAVGIFSRVSALDLGTSRPFVDTRRMRRERSVTSVAPAPHAPSYR